MTPTSADPSQDLKVSTSSPSQWGRVLSIEVPKARLEAARAQVVRELRRQVVRPGFRKGHVPTAIVERDFADRIESSALEKLIPAVADEAIRQQELQVISQPKVENLVLDDPQVVRFDLSLEVRPTLQLAPLEGMQVSRWLPEVAEADVQSALEALRDQQAQFVNVEREARDGDFVLVSYVPLDAEGHEMASGKVENYPFQVGAGSVVAEFESAARGLRPGETARVEIAYGAEHENPELAGKVVPFILTLQAVKEKHLPELDDDLARDLGLESLDGVRAKVRTDLEARLAAESERDLQETIVGRLIEANPFEPPASMVETYLEALLEDYDERYRRMRLTPEPEQREQFAVSARPAAERAVRRALLLEELTRQHKLAVTEPDVDKWIEERVEAGGSEAAQARAFWTDPRRRRRLRGELTEERVFTFLKSKAEITEVPRPTSPVAPD